MDPVLCRRPIIHMSNHVLCDTPGPATHCSDPNILISRSQKLYKGTTWPWASDFLSVGLSALSAKRGVCRSLRAGIFSKVGKGRNADVHGSQTCGENLQESERSRFIFRKLLRKGG